MVMQSWQNVVFECSFQDHSFLKDTQTYQVSAHRTLAMSGFDGFEAALKSIFF